MAGGEQSAVVGDPALSAMEDLARHGSFREVSVFARSGGYGTTPTRRVVALCEIGARLLDLDAEDFDKVDFLPGHIAQRVARCWMPQHPRSANRGSLVSLVPAYSLMLEVMELRWRRREMLHVVAVAHLMAEFLPLLAWEPMLGHAGDPLRLLALAGDEPNHWGRDTRTCRHSPRQRSAARRSLSVGDSSPDVWRRYLDHEHSHVSAALAVCGDCSIPCGVRNAHSADQLAALRERLTLANRFQQGPLVRLRHAAPVGHGFGVPSAVEVHERWTATAERVGVASSSPYPLPGLPELVSQVAGQPVTPSDVVGDVVSLVVDAVRRLPSAADVSA